LQVEEIILTEVTDSIGAAAPPAMPF